MKCFTYSSPDNAEAAISEMHARAGAKFISGGTNLIDLMKENVEKPDHLINIRNLPYKKIETTDSGGLRLGAMMTNADTAYHETVQKKYPLLSKAILAGASAQLRNMATNGGNLLQRTRCYYFYDTATPCNKREPGSGCSALAGYNRIHAILGASDNCIAVFPSDMCVALAALDATVLVTGRSGQRNIPFVDFHRLPGDTPHVDNELKKEEIITGIELPEMGFANNYYYLKLRDRASYAFALVSVAAALELDGDTIKTARIALGGVSHKPWRNVEVEERLVGRKLNAETFTEAAFALTEGAHGFEHNAFKITLAQRAVVRAFTEAAKLNSRQ